MDVTIVTVSRPETTATVTRGAARFLTALGYALASVLLSLAAVAAGFVVTRSIA